MADIAILVAEEYERRIKNSTTGGRPGGGGGSDLVEIKWVSLLNQIQNVKKVQAVRLKKWGMEIMEPKSKIGVAASNGFFSA